MRTDTELSTKYLVQRSKLTRITRVMSKNTFNTRFIPVKKKETFSLSKQETVWGHSQDIVFQNYFPIAAVEQVWVQTLQRYFPRARLDCLTKPSDISHLTKSG